MRTGPGPMEGATAMRSVLAWCSVAAALFGAVFAARAGPDDPAPEKPFYVFWAVAGPHEANPDRRVDLGPGPISRGLVVFSASDCGMYPLAGPHIIETAAGGRELYIQRHL